MKNRGISLRRKQTGSYRARKKQKEEKRLETEPLISCATIDSQWLHRGHGEVNTTLPTERPHFRGTGCRCALPGEISSVELSAVLNQLQLAGTARLCCSETLTAERAERQTDGYWETGRLRNRWVYWYKIKEDLNRKGMAFVANMQRHAETNWLTEACNRHHQSFRTACSVWPRGGTIINISTWVWHSFTKDREFYFLFCLFFIVFKRW